ncbi:hypothetical protein CPT31_01985 [Enterobacter hormaechei]|uniref:hypothetical protein n=1 Tax=Enterobacter hormaechei TaxID=158836 RepID=UPI001373C2C2|nr:hypothetical protein [Enterobacter hormaechei]QHO79848.1 hypothetical protein CPT31_01985 [Enterobacter hormaechei]QHO96946.1 hypothetical protein C5I89_02000 [Enterobacter hormaechei]
MKSILLAAIIGMASSTAMAAEASFKVSSGPSNAGTLYSKVYITSRSDSVVIKKIVVNRGNCQDAEAMPWKPVRLGFGNTVDRLFVGKGFMSACNILEIAIDTDKGTWTFNTSQ